MGSRWADYLCGFCSLIASCTFSEGQSKNAWATRSLSLSFINSLGQNFSTSVCTKTADSHDSPPQWYSQGSSHSCEEHFTLCLWDRVYCGFTWAPWSTPFRSQLGAVLLFFLERPLPWELLPSHGCSLCVSHSSEYQGLTPLQSSWGKSQGPMNIPAFCVLALLLPGHGWVASYCTFWDLHQPEDC